MISGFITICIIKYHGDEKRERIYRNMTGIWGALPSEHWIQKYSPKVWRKQGNVEKREK